MSAQPTIPVIFNNETQLFRSIEQCLGHVFAISLAIGPGRQIHSFPQSGCESFAGLFCLELFASLNGEDSQTERIATLQELWQWIVDTIRKVI
jgi:hypothetical protein